MVQGDRTFPNLEETGEPSGSSDAWARLWPVKGSSWKGKRHRKKEVIHLLCKIQNLKWCRSIFCLFWNLGPIGMPRGTRPKRETWASWTSWEVPTPTSVCLFRQAEWAFPRTLPAHCLPGSSVQPSGPLQPCPLACSPAASLACSPAASLACTNLALALSCFRALSKWVSCWMAPRSGTSWG